MTVKEVIDLLETIAQKEGYNTECIVEIEEQNYNTEAKVHTVCTVGYQDGTKKICLLGIKGEESDEE